MTLCTPRTNQSNWHFITFHLKQRKCPQKSIQEKWRNMYVK